LNVYVVINVDIRVNVILLLKQIKRIHVVCSSLLDMYVGPVALYC